MADKKEHLRDINDWLKEMEYAYKDRLHPEYFIIDLLKERLAHCMELIDIILNEEK